MSVVNVDCRLRRAVDGVLGEHHPLESPPETRHHGRLIAANELGERIARSGPVPLNT